MLVAVLVRNAGREGRYQHAAVTGSRAAKLYSMGGAGFHARRRYGCVAYRTQRVATPIDRVLLQRDRLLVRKLKSDDPDLVPKPRWMRWKTYQVLVDKRKRLEMELDQ